MATSSIAVTQGSGKNVASNSFTEDAVTKEAQRVVLNTSAGAEIATAGAPVRIDPTGTTAQPVTDNGGLLSIDDGEGTLTVDAAAAAPLAVRGSDGAALYDVAKASQLPSALTANGNLSVALASQTAGGLTIYRNLDVDEVGVNVKGSAGQVYVLWAFNRSGATRYFKLYNKATAPVVGTDTPVLTFPMGTGNTAILSLVMPHGLVFSSGIGIGATTGLGDSDVGAPALNDIVVDMGYA